jgi:hypothetical protein
MCIPQPLLRDETGDPPAGWGVQAQRKFNRAGDGGNPPKADKRSPSTLLRAMSLSNGRWAFSGGLRSRLDLAFYRHLYY